MTGLKLGQALDALIDHRGKTPRKLGSDFTDSGVRVVSANLVRDGRLLMEDARCVTPEVAKRWMPVATQAGDVILTSEAPLGRVARVPSNEPLVLGQRLFGLRGRRGVLDNGYLFYLLQTDDTQQRLEGRSTGTTVFGIRQTALLDLDLDLPPLPTQCAIAEVLGALDDKIAANLAVAVASDRLVRALYEDMRGAETIAVDDLFSNVRDAVKPPIESAEYVGLEHVPRRSMWLESTGSVDGLMSGKFLFERDDVLFGKLRPYFHKVVVSDRRGVCSTDILVLRPHRRDLNGYCWAAVSSDAVVERVSAMSAGTRMPRTSWGDLANCEVPWPGEVAARGLADKVVTLRDRVSAGLAESRHLAALRDTLLPHLMSGRITVRDAEAHVERVI